MDEFSSGLSEEQLKYGYWFAAHRLVVRQVLVAIAWAIIGILLAYTLYGLTDLAVLGGAKERALALSMQNNKVDFAGSGERTSPRDLSVASTLSLPGSEGKMDFLSKVKNPNTGWSAELDYAFIYGSAETPVQKGFVLPGEEVLLIVYNIPNAGSIQPVFRAKEIRWKRVPPHEVGPYEPFAKAHLQFDISVPENSFVDFGGKRITKTKFNVTNRSAFSYWYLPLIVTLEQGGAPAVAQTVVVDRLKSGESRAVEATWYSEIPAGATPVIVPHVNLLDPSVYMPLAGDSTETDIRERKIEPIGQ